jgi:PadR family transcriptional regulator, regulatory protein PadR
MTRRATLGEFEHVVLLALLRLGRDGYGMQVRREIAQRAGRDVSAGAVYATLDRLEEKGLVRSDVSAPVAERGGRARRTFTVTARGARALRAARRTLKLMSEGLFPEPHST